MMGQRYTVTFTTVWCQSPFRQTVEWCLVQIIYSNWRRAVLSADAGLLVLLLLLSLVVQVSSQSAVCDCVLVHLYTIYGQVRRSRSKFTITGGNVAKMVSAHSSEGFLVTTTVGSKNKNMKIPVKR